VTVQPSCEHTASIAEKELSPVRASKNTPAIDCTSTAPPTLANADPLTVTCTLLPVNLPSLVASVVTLPPLSPPLGDDGDEPLQPANSSARVALDVAQQNRRREMSEFVSDIAPILCGSQF
jgi:hypothetical protein